MWAVYNRSVIRHRFAVAGFGLVTAVSLVLVAIRATAPARTECFLLYEVGVGQIRREPSSGCATRVTPASTFKIPHALAALDAGVLEGADTRIAYDGAPVVTRVFETGEEALQWSEHTRADRRSRGWQDP